MAPFFWRRKTNRSRRPRRRSRGLLARIESLERRELLSAAGLVASYDQQPIRFESNQGQAPSDVQFTAHGAGYGVALTADGAILNLSATGATANAGPSDLITMRLLGGNSAATAAGLDELAGKSNYLIGSDPSQWHTQVANYARVQYEDIYPGINLVYYGNQQQLEYDYQLAAGADPSAIRLAFSGAQSLSIDGSGNLIVHAAGGDVVEHAPVVYQQINGQRQIVAGRYVLDGDQVGFQIGAYDPSQPLVIDPVLDYSRYLGGSDTETGAAIAVDSSGAAYVTGYTYSTNFPVVDAVQPALAGKYSGDAFITKLNPDGSLAYSTYLGGTSEDEGAGIAVDGSGNAYVVGRTFSTDFPTRNAMQPTYGGGYCDAFVAKLNPDGTLNYSTYLSGSARDYATAVAVDSSGVAYVTGEADSRDFPVAAGQATNQGATAFVTKLAANGSLLSSVFLGGTAAAGNNDTYGAGIAVDNADNVYVTGLTNFTNFPTTANALQPTYGGGGSDAFMAKLTPTGTVAYATYLGGQDYDTPKGIAVDGAGNAYITGYTSSTNFPVLHAFQPNLDQPDPTVSATDAFVTKIDADGSLGYSTYLGGNGGDQGESIAADSSGDAYLTGLTGSTDFPTQDPVQSTSAGGYDAFVTRLDPNGALSGSTYLGSSAGDGGYGIAVDPSGAAYITGFTGGSNFPTAGAVATSFQGFSDAIVAKLAFAESSATQLALTSSSASGASTYGGSVTFTATVSAAGGTPNGTVQFVDGTTVLDTETLDAKGVASFTTSALDAGTHSIEAIYPGNANFLPSTGAIQQIVNPASLVISVADATKTYGQDDSALLTGTISGIQNSDPISASYTSAGSASVANVGTYAITATASDGGSGKLANYTVTVAPGTLTVDPASTTTALTSSADPSILGQSVTFTAMISAVMPGTATTAIPAGSVRFYDGTTLLATVTLSDGTASFTTAALAAGDHTIFASYGGDTDFQPSATSLTQAVHYSFGGFLPPVGNHGAFHADQTVPIKFALSDANGNTITDLNAVASITIQRTDATGTPIGGAFAPATQGRGLSVEGSHFALNWQTKGLAPGYYDIIVTLADGTTHTKQVQLL